MEKPIAIAIHADPETFLIDEALSVGDGRFQQKCMRRIREFSEQGGSIIFVSHDLNAVKMVCDRVIVLDQGSIAIEGDPEEAVNYYNQLLAAQLLGSSSPKGPVSLRFSAASADALFPRLFPAGA